jgi:hypothetical protein
LENLEIESWKTLRPRFQKITQSPNSPIPQCFSFLPGNFSLVRRVRYAREV